MLELDSFTCHLGEHSTEPLSLDHKEQLSHPELGKPVLMMRTLTSVVPFRVARSDISGKPYYLVEQPDGTCTYLSRCELGLPYVHYSLKEHSWFYRDAQGSVQGPFTTSQMYLWHRAGYFTAGLQIRFTENGTFLPLRSLFPAGTKPFCELPVTSVPAPQHRAQRDHQVQDAALAQRPFLAGGARGVG